MASIAMVNRIYTAGTVDTRFREVVLYPSRQDSGTGCGPAHIKAEELLLV
jgi:hypothetical protein